MEPLKEIYSPDWIKNLSYIVTQVDPKIKPEVFQKKILDVSWKKFELKERINRIAEVFLYFWDAPLLEIEPKLLHLIESLRGNGVSDFNFPYIFVNDIVTKSGLDDFETSMRVLEQTTVFSSAEFAIRYYYQTYFDKTIKQMEKWSKHKEAFVRRLASEGSRPMLPWGIGIPSIKKNPNIHLRILENLWNDENEIVRRSVSNHLNDISKIQPEIVVDFCKNKFGISEELDKNLKHALRGLLKKGNQTALSFFDYNPKWKATNLKLQLKKKKIKIGESLEFNVRFVNPSQTKTKLRIEYKLAFLLANGKYGIKVFQLGEKVVMPKEEVIIDKSHSFKPITTRVYYPGIQKISIAINGQEYPTTNFELVIVSK
ncbi:DNA alkylation repair protein [Leptospira bouyouniensis]|uniref:DNA alkylation repair protein n=1 Tax=Leptospira bouyouniensis TaxID=2484911 RepID=A0A7I0HTE1_9LEPT|nr:DNA alkylation repair protein [Leptospira bouyouniensis]TGK46555.1 DNA alkylation repair protein [Leptospira bouyouniensis]TGL07251.1 DNA alkylation repair protein [Leptospira bouyouniensis]TGM79655.1 DNA alkylation repair protein [Leptospira bouyouniensis]